MRYMFLIHLTFFRCGNLGHHNQTLPLRVTSEVQIVWTTTMVETNHTSSLEQMTVLLRSGTIKIKPVYRL